MLRHCLRLCSTSSTSGLQLFSNLAQRSATAKGLHVVALAPRPLPFGTGRRTLGSSSMACNAFANVDVKEASHLVQGGQHTYVDVRTVEEFAAGHCPSAVNVPVMVKQGGGMAPNPQFLEQFEGAFPNKADALCVGCQAGKRSEMAAAMLSQAGYTNLKNVEGGFAAWAGANLPVEK